MPIRFDQKKKYVVVANEIRVPYYEERRRRFSLDLDIFTLNDLKNLFSSPNVDKKHFADREIIISGYYHEGNEIAQYLNSLSSNMSIGYELEEDDKEKEPITFHDVEEELKECLKMMEIYKKKGDVYLFNLYQNDFSFPSYVHICNALVAPLDGYSFVIGCPKNKNNDLKRILKTSRTVFVSSSLK